MIRVDLHIHTEHSPDSLLPVATAVRRCSEAGLGLIAITDHNSIDGTLRAREIADLPVIIGEEVTTAQGELTGLFLSEVVPRGLSVAETARRIRDQGGIVSMPHPFDVFRRNVIRREALSEVLELVDIVEGFNARNTLASSNARAMALAESHGLPVTAVSDAHTAMELGRTYTEINLEGPVSPSSLLAALAGAALVERPITPLIHVLTTSTKLGRRLGLLPGSKGTRCVA